MSCCFSPDINKFSDMYFNRKRPSRWETAFLVLVRKDFSCSGYSCRTGNISSVPLFALAVTAAIVIVSVPAEKTDIDDAGPDGDPRRTEVDQTKLIEHFSPSLVSARKETIPSAHEKGVRIRASPAKLLMHCIQIKLTLHSKNNANVINNRPVRNGNVRSYSKKWIELFSTKEN